MTWQSIGLIVFVSTIGISVVVLLIDLWLYLTGRKMITTYSRENPWLAAIILILLEIGVMGLAIHFMAPVPVHSVLVPL